MKIKPKPYGSTFFDRWVESRLELDRRGCTFHAGEGGAFLGMVFGAVATSYGASHLQEGKWIYNLSLFGVLLGPIIGGLLGDFSYHVQLHVSENHKNKRIVQLDDYFLEQLQKSKLEKDVGGFSIEEGQIGIIEDASEEKKTLIQRLFFEVYNQSYTESYRRGQTSSGVLTPHIQFGSHKHFENWIHSIRRK